MTGYKINHRFQCVINDAQISIVRLLANKSTKVLQGNYTIVHVRPSATNDNDVATYWQD